MKPSLLQTLLNRPSRSYVDEASAPRRQREAYHSLKAEMQRAAAVLEAPACQTEWTNDEQPVAGPSSAGNSVDAGDSSSDEDDVFYTPNTSPRTSTVDPDQQQSPTTLMALVALAPSQSSASSTTSQFSTFSWDGYSDNSLSRPTTPSTAPTSRSPSPSSASPPKRRTRTLSASSTSSDWAKDVRWLVPPQDNLSSAAMAFDTNTTPRRRRSPPSSKYEPSRSIAERMSAVWEEEEGEDGTVTTGMANLHRRSRTISAPKTLMSPSHRRANSIDTGSHRSSSTSRTMRTVRTVDIPTPLPVSDGGNPSGYTTLVLPRAGPPMHPKRASGLFSLTGSTSSVDITRSGLAQTTMSTISLTKDSALANSRKFLSFGSNAKPAPTPAHLQAQVPSPLSFTSVTAPPNKVHSSQVLVQVWAVGLDALDEVIVHERAAKGDSFGFVPGRSFVGRVVECGYDVDSVAKSDWVMGLLEMRKSGALAEFILVDKRRLTRCPRPSLHPSHGLTVDQLALLPLCGIPAHRAVRTCAEFPRGSRALVLQAHTGAGALVLQELAAKHVRVTAQVSPASDADEKADHDDADEMLFGADPEERVLGWGANEVIVDTPLAAINTTHESEFDFVVDTVGGRRIWDASRRVLHSTGQFTTLVGDASSAIPSFNTVFKSNMRSLRRAFVKKDRKALGYAWVAPVADVDGDGEDVRDSLGAVARLAGEGVLRPFVPRSAVLPFERTPMAFAGGMKVRDEAGMFVDGRTVVVRIVSS